MSKAYTGNVQTGDAKVDGPICVSGYVGPVMRILEFAILCGCFFAKLSFNMSSTFKRTLCPGRTEMIAQINE
jgi:hypothetical protein